MFEKKEQPMMIIEPHKKKSRPAVDKDAEYIARQASEMMFLAVKIERSRNLFSEVFAIHHSQVSRKPIDFYILNPDNQKMAQKYNYSERSHFIIVNPKIIKHTATTVQKSEGCLSFPGKIDVVVERWNKVVLQFQTLVRQDNGTFSLSDIITEDLSGTMAQVAQHEIDHANAKFIWNL